MAEDEVGCSDSDYKIRGLIPKSANFVCQSKQHNQHSPAIRATIFNWTLRNSGSDWDESYFPNVTIIPGGTIVNVFSTRCDKIAECWGNADEYNCGGFAGYINFTMGNLQYHIKQNQSICFTRHICAIIIYVCVFFNPFSLHFKKL